MTWLATLILVLAPALVVLEIVNRRRERAEAREMGQMVNETRALMAKALADEPATTEAR